MAIASAPRRSTELRITPETQKRVRVEKMIRQSLSDRGELDPVELIRSLQGDADGASVVREALWNLIDRGAVRLGDDLRLSLK